MTGKFFLSAFAAVAAVVVIASPQDPSFEFPAAKHVGFNIQKDAPPVAGLSSDQMSATFKNATWREVLDWLKDQNINFVVGENEINKDLHINIHVVNVSTDALMGALASALDGRWDKKNDIWVFRKGKNWIGTPEAVAGVKGETFFAPSVAGTGKTQVFSSPPTPPVWVADGKNNPFAVAQGKLFTDPKTGSRTFIAPGTPMTPEQQELFKKSMGKMDDPKAWAEFQKNWEKWAKDYEKNFKEFEKNMKGFDGKSFKGMTDGSTVFIDSGQGAVTIDQKKLEDIQKRALELSKAAENSRIFLRNKYGELKLDQKAMEEMRKHMVEMTKSADGHRVLLGDSAKGWNVVRDGKSLTAKQLKELKASKGVRTYSLGDGGSVFIASAGSSGTSMKNIKAIYDLMTPAQELKVKRQGYLNLSDLNAKQRSLLGVVSGDSWSVSYKTDKWGLTIKSDR